MTVAQLVVSSLTSPSEQRYEQYVRTHSQGLLYYSLSYKRFLESLLGCESEYLMVEDRGRVAGVLPMMVRSGPLGRVYNSLPFYGSIGGPLCDHQEALDSLVQAFLEKVGDSDVAAATVVDHPFSKFQLSAQAFENRIPDQRLLQYTEIGPPDGDPSFLLSRVEPSARRNYRKAVAAGIEVTVENGQLSRLAEIHWENMEAIGGRPKSSLFFELLPQFFVANRDYRIYVARRGDQVQAALLLLYFGNVVEYFVPVVLEEARSSQPMAAILVRAMGDAAQHGFRLWNWGGTWLSQAGVFRFKRKWGATTRPYSYTTLIRNPSVYRSSPEELIEDYGNFFVVPFSRLCG